MRVIKTQLGHHASAVIGNHHVGVTDQTFDDAAAACTAQINADVAFVAVECNELRIAETPGFSLAGIALPVAVLAFDLDDLRAHVAQQRGGIWPGDAFGHVDDFDVAQDRVFHFRLMTGVRVTGRSIHRGFHRLAAQVQHDIFDLQSAHRSACFIGRTGHVRQQHGVVEFEEFRRHIGFVVINIEPGAGDFFSCRYFSSTG